VPGVGLIFNFASGLFARQVPWSIRRHVSRDERRLGLIATSSNAGPQLLCACACPRNRSLQKSSRHDARIRKRGVLPFAPNSRLPVTALRCKMAESPKGSSCLVRLGSHGRERERRLEAEKNIHPVQGISLLLLRCIYSTHERATRGSS
jgi:hypothetical protein